MAMSIATNEKPGGADAGDLRPCSVGVDSSTRAPGPFAAGDAQREVASGIGAMLTGLLVLYPAFATVAVVLAVIFLTGSAGTA